VIETWKRVLVLAPHTDDGEFGCGGTMARLVEAGIEVHYHAFSIATRSLPPGFAPDTLAREVREATGELGIPESHLAVHDFDVVSSACQRTRQALHENGIAAEVVRGIVGADHAEAQFDVVDDPAVHEAPLFHA